MQFEQRDFEGARAALEESMRTLRRAGYEDMAMKAEGNLHGVHWHTGEFEPAIVYYRRFVEIYEGDEANHMAYANALGNLCYVYLSIGRWDEAVEAGRRCVATSDHHSGHAWVVYGPLGLALFQRGERVEGLRLIGRALAETLSEGIPRFNQIALDYAVIALARSGLDRVAQCLLHAAVERRTALRHAHSPAERGLIRMTTDLDPSDPPPSDNPLSGQPAATLSEWACEEIERLIRRENLALGAVR